MGVSTDAILVYGVQLEEGQIPEYESFAEEDMGELYNVVYNGDGEVDGVQLVQHCSDAYPMWIVGIPEARTIAWRGHPKLVATRPPDGDWNDRIEAFVKKHNLKTEGETGWWLCSMWG